MTCSALRGIDNRTVENRVLGGMYLIMYIYIQKHVLGVVGFSIV